jgi:hypothetical protein
VLIKGAFTTDSVAETELVGLQTSVQNPTVQPPNQHAAVLNYLISILDLCQYNDGTSLGY